MTNNDNKQRSYMALAPLTSLAGIFISPLASTAAPFILFFIFSKSRPEVAKVALQTADLAFSIQLWIILISLSLMLGISLDWIIVSQAKEITATATSVILLIFVASLMYSLYQALNAKAFTHIFSFKVAERVFNLVNKRNAKIDSSK